MMVKSGHAAVPEVGYAAPRGTPPGMEVMSLSALGGRVCSGGQVLPQRPAFHHLVAVHSGKFAHTVDLTRHVLRPGEWLWVRPGQIQQWGPTVAATGTVVMFEPGFVDPPTLELARVDSTYLPVHAAPSAAEAARLNRAIRDLAEEFESPLAYPAGVRTAMMRHLLGAILLRLAHLDSTAADDKAGETHVIFRLFQAAVEQHFTSTRSVADYGRRLGYSSRTLSRAAEAATGVSAKRFIDRRVVLEAQRLLAHTDLAASAVATELGFSSATNFSKFFGQHTEQAPIGFRRRVRGGG
jgi:AraC-like DNA-binding protein